MNKLYWVWLEDKADLQLFPNKLINGRASMLGLVLREWSRLSHHSSACLPRNPEWGTQGARRNGLQKGDPEEHSRNEAEKQDASLANLPKGLGHLWNLKHDGGELTNWTDAQKLKLDRPQLLGSKHLRLRLLPQKPTQGAGQGSVRVGNQQSWPHRDLGEDWQGQQGLRVAYPASGVGRVPPEHRDRNQVI